MKRVAIGLALLWNVACGSSLPARFVIEQDTGDYHFRRYQKSLDAEIPVEGNAATAHLATYVKRGETLRVAPVTVTAYEKSDGLAEAIRAVLRGMPGYTYGVDKQGGHWVWTLKGEQGDDWVLWPSGHHLVKMGVPEDDSEVPEELLAAYLDAYPSGLDRKGNTVH